MDPIRYILKPHQCTLHFHEQVMQVSVSSKTIPPGQTPGTRLEGSKNPTPGTLYDMYQQARIQIQIEFL